jgi:hypothetical protein
MMRWSRKAARRGASPAVLCQACREGKEEDEAFPSVSYPKRYRAGGLVTGPSWMGFGQVNSSPLFFSIKFSFLIFCFSFLI